MKAKLQCYAVCLALMLGVGSVTQRDLTAAERRCSEQPNVVFILADDLGWSDTTLYGTTSFYKTPNIQRLAGRGMTFTRAYAASPLCSPTRASLLTGLSPARHGITAPRCHLPQVMLEAVEGSRAAAHKMAIEPTSVTRLKPEYYTLAEAFRDAGYTTGHFGKWHLGAEPYSALQHGFDVDVPHWHGPGPAGSYLAPWKFPDFDPDPDIPNEHIEDRMAKEAVSFMEQHRDEPFFLNYWMFSVHATFDAKQDLIEAYRDQVDPQNPQRCPTYAAMINSMDDAVGTLLSAIDRLGLAERTIIVLASDNGGNMYSEVNGQVPTSNAPLRGGKATLFEGGIRGPCVVVCPWLTPPGSRNDAIIQSCDFYPTLLELADIAPRQSQACDGRTFVDFLQGVSIRCEPIFTYFPHSPAVPDWLPASISVHLGEWKLIRIFHGEDAKQHRYLLYHLAEDIGEQHNLAAQYPRRVQELDAMIEDHLVQTQAVRPIPNPEFDRSKYDPSLEGQPARSRRDPPSTAPRPRSYGPRVAGWRPDHHCQLELVGEQLVVQAVGQDPYLSFAFEKALPKGKLTLSLTMSSNQSDRGQLFWSEEGVKPPFFRERSIKFEVQGDGKPHDYQLEFEPGHPIDAIRIDPLTTSGEVRIGSMTLSDERGDVLYEWNFTKSGAQ